MMQKRLVGIIATAVALVCAATAQADPAEYGLKEAGASTATLQAGRQSDFTLSFALKTEADGSLPATTQDTVIRLPPGLLGNPTAVPKCTTAQLVETQPNDKSSGGSCPQASQVGVTEVIVFKNGSPTFIREPVFNLDPLPGEPARLGFFALVFPVIIDTEVDSEREYAITARIAGISALVPLLSAKTTLWGDPADESHDSERMTVYESAHNGGVPETPTGTRPSGIEPAVFMFNPTRCGLNQAITVTAEPYALPGLSSELGASLGPFVGCDLLDFSPRFALAPTTEQAETGTGLNVDLNFPAEGTKHPNLLAEDELKRAEVTLPEGVTVNPSEASGGLGVCTEADLEHETASSGPKEGCPETSKIGTVTATSPLIEEPAEGALYLAQPYQNPSHTLLAIYMVLKIPARGVIVKLDGKVVPDPRTGQLVATFGGSGNEIPQLPVSSFHLHFREGARAPLVTPPRCGTYSSTAVFESWGGHVVTSHPSFEITHGVGGGPCPIGTTPFDPGFQAGSESNAAGSYSPFDLMLTRNDGDQDLTRFSAQLPPGLIGKLAGLSRCSDAAIAAAATKTGLEEQADPSCPVGSEVGNVLAGAGVGSVLTYAKGKVYLAGPYKGARLSVAAIVPAVAGPFDLGTVVTREALRIDPISARVEADGSSAQPIPHILQGIPLNLRDIRVYIDRPEFTLNATSCEEEQTQATLWGGGTVLAPMGETPVGLQARYQAADCASLGFKPKLKLMLKGPTRRAGLPRLKAVVTPRKGDANIGRAVVTLPKSEFLEQGHIKTVCTRVQFNAGGGNGEQCPARSVYGHAVARTPLLDEPLEGPVFLRSNGGERKLPDLVAALHSNDVDIDLLGFIKSLHPKGASVSRIRTIFAAVPDAPVTKFTLEMFGGKKGLLVNSANLCKGKHRAISTFVGQNGRRSESRPAVHVHCKQRHKKRAGHKNRKAAPKKSSARVVSAFGHHVAW